MPKRCMIDLETYGTECIVAIGACAFDTSGVLLDDPNEEVKATLEVNIDPSTAGQGRPDGSTVDWWLRQDDQARAALFAETRHSLHDALTHFRRWYIDSGFTELWSHATYDAVVLRSRYEAIGIPTPWHYRDVRDLRTLFALFDKEQIDDMYRRAQERESRPRHIALVDAIVQSHVAGEALFRISIGGAE